LEASGAFVESFTVPPRYSGPLDGLTFVVKDLIDVAGHITGCGNPDWRKGHPPAVCHALCVEQLLGAGGWCVGKTVTDELAFGLLGENYFYGTPLNPRAPDRVPGGSSSGSASAVASGLADFALGTDTGGSVRVPASNCGIFGWRPTHGRISVAGVNPFSPVFDTVGVLASNGEVLGQVGSVLLGRKLGEDEPERILWVTEAFELADSEVRDAAHHATKQLKPAPKEISINNLLPRRSFNDLYECFRIIEWGEIWSCLGSWIESAHPALGPATQKSFDLCRNLDRGLIEGAVQVRESICAELEKKIGKEDLLCFPTIPQPAPLKESIVHDRSQSDYYRRALQLTALSGVGRLPQVSLPLAEVEGLPVGVSFAAARERDEFLLSYVSRFR